MPQKTMHVDLSTDDLEGIELEQEVTITVKGTVKELRAEQTMDFGPDDSEVFSPSIMVEVSTTKVKLTGNKFSEMSEDE